MINRRNFIKSTGLITISYLFPTIPTYAAQEDAEILIKSLNKLLNDEFSMKLKQLLADDCFLSGGGVKCEFEYEDNKRRQNVINGLFPELKELLKTNSDYSINLSKSIDIGINIKNKNVEFMLPKEELNIDKKEVLILENIVKNLFNQKGDKIFNDGKNADINCVKGSKSVKCIFTYENLGKRGQFINTYAPKINNVDATYSKVSFEIRTNKKYSYVEKYVERIILVTEDY